MANISSINGEPIVVDASGIKDESIGVAKLASDTVDTINKSGLAFLPRQTLPLLTNDIVKHAFNPNTGVYGVNESRLAYRGGIPLSAAKALSIITSDSYGWNLYFANTENGSYQLISYYSSVWIYGTRTEITVPDDADRGFVNFVKSDGTAFTDDEMYSVFSVEVIGDDEPHIVSLAKIEDFETQRYGRYQYVNEISNAEYHRLTQDKLYSIDGASLLGIHVDEGYNAVVNFFDAELRGLGNNGAWLVGEVFVNLKKYAAAEYLKISYRRSDNGIVSESDYNKVSLRHPCIRTLLPSIVNSDIECIETYDYNSGDVAAYNGEVFFAVTGAIRRTDGTEISGVTLGHGNNIMFGRELDGEYPHLYAGSWYQGQKNVYVNRVAASGATLVETITYEALPNGFLNACVDEPNERVYIFMETGTDTYQGEILFAVGDFGGNIISSKPLELSMPIIQGMDFFDGHCYVTIGNGTASYPNHIYIFDTNGNLVGDQLAKIWGEIEGISIDKDNTVYVKAISSLYKV